MSRRKSHPRQDLTASSPYLLGHNPINQGGVW